MPVKNTISLNVRFDMSPQIRLLIGSLDVCFLTKMSPVSVTLCDLSIYLKEALGLKIFHSNRKNKRRRHLQSFLITGTHIDLRPRVGVSSSNPSIGIRARYNAFQWFGSHRQGLDHSRSMVSFRTLDLVLCHLQHNERGRKNSFSSHISGHTDQDIHQFLF